LAELERSLRGLDTHAVFALVFALAQQVKADAEAGTLTISDTGVGMTKAELVQNLGTIAHSGTKQFAEMLGSKDASSNLIGQFGVGFYAAFLVADRVVVVSKSNDDADQWIWESSADSNFSLVKDPHGNTLGRGTSITLHIKQDEDSQKFLKSDTLRDLIIRYSDFISFPIFLWESHVERVPVNEEVKAEDKEEDVEVEDEDEETDEKKEEDKETKPSLVWDWERINDKMPIWTRSKDDIEEEVRFGCPRLYVCCRDN
jgi:heat shock protein beta